MRETLLLAAGLMALASGQASAHARLVHASPKVGEVVRRSPTEVRLWFSETIELPLSRVTLAPPGGPEVPTGRLALDPQDRHVVVTPLPAGLPPGPYRLNWRVISVDGHRTEGDFTFRVQP